ncbi:hypothetical protein [Nannocystis pusilla]|uniref:hypothetical protein n=1 Tax=Nannocystis pusilla TaxID=889268 RepID=UPI003B7A922D
MPGFFADDGKGALRRAIEAFEAGTAAELVIAVRPASDRYAHVPALVGGLAAALTLAFLLYGEPEFGLHWFLVDPLLVGLAAGWLVRHSHALARGLTPRAWRDEAVLRAAKAGFLDHGVMETRAHRRVPVPVADGAGRGGPGRRRGPPRGPARALGSGSRRPAGRRRGGRPRDRAGAAPASPRGAVRRRCRAARTTSTSCPTRCWHEGHV